MATELTPAGRARRVVAQLKTRSLELYNDERARQLDQLWAMAQRLISKEIRADREARRMRERRR